MVAFAPEVQRARQIEQAPRALTFDERYDFATWRRLVATQLQGMIGVIPAHDPLDVRVEYTARATEYHETRFVFTAEAGADVPAHLLVPTHGQPPYPVMICLQGHTSGMHISLGRPQFPGDEASIAEDRDYALQARRQGYAALVIEQRAFGERRDRRPDHVRHVIDRPCHFTTLTALLLGRTLLGERVFDVSRAIDALAAFPDLDLQRIGCVGDSTGGTIAYFAAALDERIAVTMPAAYVCAVRHALGAIDHCEDHYLPGFLNYFDIGDIAGLIAPRGLVVVTGRDDPSFPLAGVEEAFATIQRIYAAAGAPQRARLVVGNGGHRFFADLAWPVFHEVAGW
ncbi:MAG: alpha/beta hydrolase family protein [Caldilinea sp.]